MGEGFQFIDIILFAMIAAFLILRLRSVLGRHRDSGRSDSGFSTKQGLSQQEEAPLLKPDKTKETDLKDLDNAEKLENTDTFDNIKLRGKVKNSDLPSNDKIYSKSNRSYVFKKIK